VVWPTKHRTAAVPRLAEMSVQSRGCTAGRFRRTLESTAMSLRLNVSFCRLPTLVGSKPDRRRSCDGNRPGGTPPCSYGDSAATVTPLMMVSLLDRRCDLRQDNGTGVLCGNASESGRTTAGGNRDSELCSRERAIALTSHCPEFAEGMGGLQLPAFSYCSNGTGHGRQ
jgi:hypothetical protein